jgi:hypothetical protein
MKVKFFNSYSAFLSAVKSFTARRESGPPEIPTIARPIALAKNILYKTHLSKGSINNRQNMPTIYKIHIFMSFFSQGLIYAEKQNATGCGDGTFNRWK